jgi:phosphatidylglycerol---prolipoprotein diacylglyceryl transferase
MNVFPSIAAIKFPDVDPVIFQIGPLAIRWYGLAYVVGFALSYLILRRAARTGALRVPPDAVDSLLAWIVFGVVAGGRAGWWLFYHRGGRGSWYEPFALWNGGMSFHGGLIGVTAAVAIWTWRRNVRLWNVADNLALAAPVGILLGRIANLVNAELVGRATDLPWGVVFPGEPFPRHPSQLYEALGKGSSLA